MMLETWVGLGSIVIGCGLFVVATQRLRRARSIRDDVAAREEALREIQAIADRTLARAAEIELRLLAKVLPRCAHRERKWLS